MAKPHLLYIAPQLSSFVKKDIAVLETHYAVRYRGFSGSGMVAAFKSMLGQFFFLLWYAPRARRIVVMFGGYHAFLPALMGKVFWKKVFIILGGTDCVSFPSINYGTFRKKFQGKVTCASYRLAHQLLPVHASLMLRRDTYYTVDSEYQGCQFWCKGLKTTFREIHNGYDPARWEVDRQKKDPLAFVTIAALPDATKIPLKGIDLMLDLARLLPQCKFAVIGLQNPHLALDAPPNVRILPFLPPEKLREELEKARYYFQLSLSEGFPNAICEAMLAECIPIGSNVAAIPDIVGETGYIVMQRDLALLRATVEMAMAATDQMQRGQAARASIAARFPISRREQELVEALA